jgi:hypothetical protein
MNRFYPIYQFPFWTIWIFWFVSSCPASLKFNPDKVGFSVSYKSEHSHYRINGIFLMPGENLELKINSASEDSFLILHGDSLHKLIKKTKWNWLAPDTTGYFQLIVHNQNSHDSMYFNIFVMEPADKIKNGFLNGYRIGEYPQVPFKSLPFYQRPAGFIKVNQITSQINISPHFKLGQFVCKQPSGAIKYMVLKERLILKLEAILEESNKQGYPCTTFNILSGYRTPFYNLRIENVKYSAHQWGGAADIFIDANPEDGEMDDLNKDGKIDGQDSEILFQLVDRMSLNELFLPYIGGLGKYIRSISHGPFIHVDIRGFRALW